MKVAHFLVNLFSVVLMALCAYIPAGSALVFSTTLTFAWAVPEADKSLITDSYVAFGLSVFIGIAVFFMLVFSIISFAVFRRRAFRVYIGFNIVICALMVLSEISAFFVAKWANSAFGKETTVFYIWPVFCAFSLIAMVVLTVLDTIQTLKKGIKERKYMVEKMDRSINLLEKYNRKELSDEQFLKAFANENVFYTTPFGDYKDGGQRMFVLPGPNGTGYLPLFVSKNDMRTFYNRAGRVGYLIQQGTFLSLLEISSKRNADGAPTKLGYLIDPYKYKMTFDASVVDTVIGMIKN